MENKNARKNTLLFLILCCCLGLGFHAFGEDQDVLENVFVGERNIETLFPAEESLFPQKELLKSNVSKKNSTAIKDDTGEEHNKNTEPEICHMSNTAYLERLAKMDEIIDKFKQGKFKVKTTTKKLKNLDVSYLDWLYLKEYKEFSQTLPTIKNSYEEKKLERFSESYFKIRPWLLEFKYVLVINKGDNDKEKATLRVYEKGKLIHISNVTTGRNILELKRFRPYCKNRPPTFYYSSSGEGYYTINKLYYEKESLDWGLLIEDVMFFDLDRGLALHGMPIKTGNALGFQGSGGCIRLDPATSKYLFQRVFETGGTDIPVLQHDGELKYNKKGKVMRIQYGNSNKSKINDYKTYSALVVVQSERVVRDPSVSNSLIERLVTYTYPYGYTGKYAGIVPCNSFSNCSNLDVFALFENDEHFRIE